MADVEAGWVVFDHYRARLVFTPVLTHRGGTVQEQTGPPLALHSLMQALNSSPVSPEQQEAQSALAVPAACR